MRTIPALLTAAAVLAGSNALAQKSNGSNDKDQGTTHKENKGIDREAAISHALNMAIDASGLYHLGQRESSTTAAGVQPAGGAVIQGNPGVVPGGAAPAAGVPAQGVAVAEATIQPRVNTASGSGSGAWGADLIRIGREGFQESDRLFQAVAEEGRRDDKDKKDDASRACEEFYRAARDYAKTLQALSMAAPANPAAPVAASRPFQPGDPAAPAPGGANPAAAAAGAAPVNGVAMVDAGRVALINQAVKDAVEGTGLRKLVRHHDEQGEVSRTLTSHAEKMLASSDQTLRLFNNADNRGNAAAANAAAGPASIDRLVMLGQEVIRSVRALDDSGGRDRGDTDRRRDDK